MKRENLRILKLFDIFKINFKKIKTADCHSNKVTESGILDDWGIHDEFYHEATGDKLDISGFLTIRA